ncbi:hypothetical protein [Flavobacterium eburneipallidum]|uniref:hypothetical protein n=1 Tax=Flavobacterium eburneipallidum TaxID=3003263 RepID=UPI0022AC3BB0|nr:hypothetical protein [Flavobacterium eburneipallidum]
MNKITLEDYKKAIKASYEEAKKGQYSTFLQNPSPAELKNFCLLLFDKGISKQDQEIFDLFFELDDKSSKRKQIELAKIDRLRPIGNFLRGRTENTRTLSLDLMAVLVDFNPRPFRKFIGGDKREGANIVVESTFLKEEGSSEESEIKFTVIEELKKESSSKKWVLVAMVLLFVILLSYGVKKTFFSNKNCMVWVNNHYEAADYDEVKDSLAVIVYNQSLLDNFKKVTVCDTTTFFKNGKPLFWYAKVLHKNDLECFTHPGLHPETGVTLKPISEYMIAKYIRKK